MYLIKRALTRAFGNMPQQSQNRAQQNAPHYPPRNTPPSQDVVETIWAGMSIAQLQQAFGAPSSKQVTASGEIWTYSNLNGYGIQTAITIEGGAVKSWVDSRPAPQSFPSPQP